MNRDLLRHNILRNALYHTARRLSFEALNRWFNFLVVAAGSIAVLQPLEGTQFVNAGKWGGAIAALIAAAQLAFDFGSAAHTHKDLQRRYYELLSKVQRDSDATPDQLAQYNMELTIIYADEPPIYRAIDAKAYNDAIDSLDIYSKDELLVIPFHHRILGNFLSFSGFHYENVGEQRTASATKRGA